MTPMWDLHAWWTAATAVCCSSICALLGCYLVLRRMSLLGDAIAHAVLPGVVVAALLTGQLAGWPILLGAILAGLLTAWLTETLQATGQVTEDASLGVVFTSLFALGVLLLVQFAARVDLDPGCVLYGLLEFIPLDTVTWWGWEFPRAWLTLVPVLGLTLGFVACLWKELQILAFDAALASAMGYSARGLQAALLAMVALATVASFEAVGSILVIAMLIVPAATAQLLTDRLPAMLGVAVACGMSASLVGYECARQTNTNVAGMIAVVAGGQFALAVFFAPRQGLCLRGWRQLRLGLRILREDLLAGLYRDEERVPAGVSVPGVSQREYLSHWPAGFTVRWALGGLVRRRWVERLPGGRLRLTERGRQKAVSLVRAHRLWETYLERHFDLPPDHLHAPASRIEHYLSADLQQQLSVELETPARDPHGQAIPE